MPKPLHVLIAAGEMKGSLTARKAAAAMEQGVRGALGENCTIDSLALSDGGAGFVDLMIQTCCGAPRKNMVTGALDEPLEAVWGVIDQGGQRTGIIEMSAAAGLSLVPEPRRDPEHTTTFGVGQLIRAALDVECARITIGIGNSATCDAGAGMAAALGVQFFDQDNQSIDRPSGADLIRIKRVDVGGLDPRIRNTRFTVLCDVTNPLFGPTGSAHVFAPQKGASPEQVERLDAGLRNLASLLPETDPSTPAIGAAGGLAFGLAAFCGAQLTPGADAVLDLVNFDSRVKAADLVLTCEGRFDETSLAGKLPIRVARRAKAAGARHIAILAGSVDPRTIEQVRDLAVIHTITPEDLPLENAIRRTPDLLATAVQALCTSISPLDATP